MHRTLVIFRKELRDTLRDRRTLIMMIALPLVLVPGLMLAMAYFQASQHEKAQTRVLDVGLIQNGNARSFADSLRNRPDLRVHAFDSLDTDSARTLVRADSVDAVFVVDPGFDDKVQFLEAGEITMIVKSDDQDVVLRRLRSIVAHYGRGLMQDRLRWLNLSPSVMQTVELREDDVATTQERVGRALGGFLPYVFLLFCYLGAMYPAIDLAAGEKERSTLESLLTSPATRFEILLGKFGVVVLAGLASALITIVGLVVGLQQAPELPPDVLETVQSILSLDVIFIQITLLIPLTMFLAAILLSLSIFAKSFKEATSMVSPLAFAVVIPAAIGMTPGLELTFVTSVIPILNVSLATKEVIAGTIRPELLALVYLSLIVLAAIGLLLCSWYFRNERIIFRS